jgi:predicted flap endonuclease-1-like 5' DNA nuclease
MAKKLVDVEGIGPAYAAKLEAAGVGTQEELLTLGADAKGREALAAKTGISQKLVLTWVNRADLARVTGIGGQYAELLELAGVDSVPELAQRNAANLHEAMGKINAEKHAVRQVPSLKQVEDWVQQAKGLPRVVNH